MKLWDFKAGIYRSARKTWPINLFLTPENTNVQRFIDKIDRPVNLVIDIGCGTGNASGLIKTQAPIIGVDASLAMLRKLKAFQPATLPVCADIRFLPFKPASADLVLAIGVFEYFRSVDKLLRGLAEILKSDGVLIFTNACKNVINIFRNLLGHLTYPLELHQVVEILETMPFKNLRCQKSFLQNQFSILKI